MGKIIFMKFPDKVEASEFAARTIIKTFGSLSKWDRMILGTATGQTPVLTYQKFAELVEKNKRWFDLSKNSLLFRQLYNYISPGSTEDNLPEYSYELELKRSIWKVPNGGTLIPREYAENPEEEAKRYGKIVKTTTAKADFIFQILGIGDEDGHIAFNMPGDSFDSTVHVVDLNEETIIANAYKFFDGDTTRVPRRAITMGIGDILKSNFIMLEAFGRKKANIIWKAFFTKPSTEIPATALQLFKGTVLVILDEGSASIIAEKEGEEVFSKNLYSEIFK